VADLSLLDLPFFDDRHRALAGRIGSFVTAHVEPRAAFADADDPQIAARAFLFELGREGFLKIFVPSAFGGTDATPDLRSVCLAREAIASSSALADSAFAVQGLGSYPLAIAADEPIKQRYLPRVATGEIIAAFALTEPSAGSDVSSLETEARRDGDGYVLNGTKTLISNAGIAGFYVVFATVDPALGKKGITAFIVDANAPGLKVTAPTPLLASHSIGDVTFENCRVPMDHRIGAEGQGLRVAFATLDFFRTSVAAAACGIAGRALDESKQRATVRHQFGAALSEFQAVRFFLADMAAELDASRLLVYRSAWRKDHGAERVSRDAAIAKLFATEAAQRIVDRAVQIHGGDGVRRGTVVERLYREVRALRIYEGTSEIQHLVIADHVLRAAGRTADS
jgi:acyl-CoA dehydrogenase